MRECPGEHSKSFYTAFVQSIWEVMHWLTRDIRDMKHMVREGGGGGEGGRESEFLTFT